MDALLSTYTEEQLIGELEKGHYWFADGRFCSGDNKTDDKKTAEEKPEDTERISVEYAVFFRLYN